MVDPEGKIPLKWIGLFLLIALAWHAVLFPVTRPSEKTVVAEVPKSPFMVYQPVVAPALTTMDIWSDPTVYVMPGPYGFSSRIQKIPPVGRSPDEPMELPMHPTDPFTDLTADELSREDRLSAFPSERDIWRGDEDKSEGFSDASSTSWVLFGALSSRLIRSSNQPGDVTSEVPLMPTVVRLRIGVTGMVDYAIVDKTSGKDTVDEKAIAFARTLRFDTSDDVASDWAWLKIVWKPVTGAFGPMPRFKPTLKK